MTDFENSIQGEDESLLEEGAVALNEDLADTVAEEKDTANTPDRSLPEEDWQTRCLSAEAALEDSLEFASLYLAAGGTEDLATMKENAIYQRFVSLRALGLSVKEAFSAADSAREKPLPPAASKGHLVSSHTRMKPDGLLLMGEELAIAREILGDDYSQDELVKLYRRVAKS